MTLKKLLTSIPLLICCIWNTYLIIYAGIDDGELSRYPVMYLALVIVGVLTPHFLVFDKWKENTSYIIVCGLTLLLVTGFLGNEYLSSREGSRAFLLLINLLALWFSAFIMTVIPNKKSSNK